MCGLCPQDTDDDVDMVRHPDGVVKDDICASSGDTHPLLFNDQAEICEFEGVPANLA